MRVKWPGRHFLFALSSAFILDFTDEQNE